MKLLSATLLSLTLAIFMGGYSLLKPQLTQNGTSVLYTPGDTQAGRPPTAILLPPTLTDKQRELLEFTRLVAVEDGHKYPQLVQGIIMQETHAGGMSQWRVAGLENKVGDRYFGVGQIKLAAAKDVMSRWPDLWRYLNTKTDEELQARLIVDDKFNIRVASKYALLMGINKDSAFGAAAYNKGKGGVIDASTDAYAAAVKRHATMLVAYNDRKR